MLADPAITASATTQADGARAQRKLFDLGRPRTGETVFTEVEINALLSRHLVEARGVRIAAPSVQLIGENRFLVRAQSPLQQLMGEAGLGMVADILPSRWATRPVWLRLGARVRIEDGPRRQLRIDVDEFAVGRQRLPAPALRLLLDPAAVGLLQWTLPEHVQSVGIEPERVVVQTVASR